MSNIDPKDISEILKNTEVLIRTNMSKGVYLHFNGYTIWVNKDTVYKDHSRTLANSGSFKNIGTLFELLSNLGKIVNDKLDNEKT